MFLWKISACFFCFPHWGGVFFAVSDWPLLSHLVVSFLKESRSTTARSHGTSCRRTSTWRRARSPAGPSVCAASRGPGFSCTKVRKPSRETRVPSTLSVTCVGKVQTPFLSSGFECIKRPHKFTNRWCLFSELVSIVSGNVKSKRCLLWYLCRRNRWGAVFPGLLCV